MAKFTMEMVLEYAKVFKENADYGDPEAPAKSVAGSIARKGGQTITNAYFTSDEDKQKLIDAGLDLKPLGHDRILQGNSEYGIGEFVKLKRDVEDNIKTFKNKGKPEVTVNYGGLPKIVDLRDPENKSLWDFETDGELGNGTKALVKFDMYSNGAGLRLEAIAVQELVEWIPQEEDEHADVWDV